MIDREQAPFRLPVQWVNRPNLDFRGYAGTIAERPAPARRSLVVAGSGRRRHVVTHFSPPTARSRRRARARR